MRAAPRCLIYSPDFDLHTQNPPSTKTNLSHYLPPPPADLRRSHQQIGVLPPKSAPPGSAPQPAASPANLSTPAPIPQVRKIPRHMQLIVLHQHPQPGTSSCIGTSTNGRRLRLLLSKRDRHRLHLTLQPRLPQHLHHRSPQTRRIHHQLSMLP